jgi:enoyl-CoA hydratase/carnithine racemase
MDLEHVLYESDGPLATITLNRPERLNAITGQTMAEIGEALARLQADDAVRIAIVTGAGRGFCAGGDRKETAARLARGEEFGQGAGKGPAPRSEAKPSEANRYGRGGHAPRPFYRAQFLFTTLDKPLIAAVNGPAVGGGLDLALWCDVRIASERARFGELYIDRGLVPDMGGLYLLPRVVGYAKAAELLLTGEILDAAEALRIGLVNHVVPHEQLMQRAREMALKIASKPAGGVRATKRALARLLAPDWEREGDYHEALQAQLLHGSDFREADRAFVEKRAPDFRGD